MVDWGVVAAYPVANTSVPVDTSFLTTPAVSTRFTLSRAVTEIDTTAGSGMRQVTFTVTWNSYDGRPLSRSYTTYYGQEGLYDYYYNSI